MKEPYSSNANGAPPEDQGSPIKGGNRFRRHRFRWIVIGIIILLILLIWYLIVQLIQKPPPVQPLPVVVTKSHISNVPVYVPALGTVTPTFTVTVRTQINGILLRTLFKEGQLVNAGDLLAEIDPRPFLAQLDQYQGQLARDEAQLANARIDLYRYKNLFPVGAVSGQTYATQQATVKQLEGTIAFDKGQLETIKVNLIYCRIISPIQGRVGLRLVDPGNFVQTTDSTGLVVVNTVSPIAVVFPIPEDDVPSVMEQIGLRANTSLLVKAYDRAQNKLLAIGELLTIDNQINTSTGTVKLKAQFDNKDYRLFPNQFVNIQLLVNVLPNQVVVPSAAIQHGSQGDFVYLLNKDQKTVSVREVKTGVSYADNTVISSGLAAGQYVVVIGSDKLKEGAPVSVSYQKEPTLVPIPLPIKLHRPPELPLPTFPSFYQNLFYQLQQPSVTPSGGLPTTNGQTAPIFPSSYTGGGGGAKYPMLKEKNQTVPKGGVSELESVVGREKGTIPFSSIYIPSESQQSLTALRNEALEQTFGYSGAYQQLTSNPCDLDYGAFIPRCEECLIDYGAIPVPRCEPFVKQISSISPKDVLKSLGDIR